MQLNDHDLQDINGIAAWLALNPLPDIEQSQADLIILAGNPLLPVTECAAALAKKLQRRLLISGGFGHATAPLAETMAQHPRYCHIDTRGKSEAHMLAALAQRFAGLPDEYLLLEGKSRNCGENAAFSQHLLDKMSIKPQRVVLVQDPLLQRRTDATFRWQWRNRSDAPQFISWPVFTPQLTREAGNIGISGIPPGGIGSLPHFLSLLMGEVQRLHDDEQGYGPRGKGFFGPVEMPDAIYQAWLRLMRLPEIQQRIRR